MLTLTTKESYFLFDVELYQQVDSVSMGSPLGPILANVFICHCFNFSDIKVIREDVFTTSVYRKPSFSGVYTHFDSYMPLSYKFSLVSTIIFHSFTICSDIPRFHQEICKIKKWLQ